MRILVSSAHESLVNLTYPEAIARLRDRDVFVRVLTPPQDSVGKGRLRVVRAEEKGESIELVLTYDDFERLHAHEKPRAQEPGTTKDTTRAQEPGTTQAQPKKGA